MNLLHQIKSKRAKAAQKEPLKKSAFYQVSYIVRKYMLNEDFLRVLDGVEGYLSNANLNANRVRVKVSMERPLFSLITQNEYEITLSIIRKIDNPFLLFVHSPEEILLCGPLYQLNPSLSPEKLARYHFETLFLHERNKADNQESDVT